MLILPTSHYMQLGEIVLYLLSAQKGWPLHGQGHVLDNISELINLVDELKLPATQAQAQELRKFGDNLSREWGHRSLSESEVKQLTSIVSRLRETLHAESGEQVACVLVDDRFGAGKLLTDVRYLMTARVYDLLPEPVRKDFTDAGRCIAFELPDSAALHLARGYEALIEHYQRSRSGGHRMNNRKWGLTAGDLLECLDGAPAGLREQIESTLRELGHAGSNASQAFTIERVKELFTRVTDTSVRIMEDLAGSGSAREAAGVA